MNAGTRQIVEGALTAYTLGCLRGNEAAGLIAAAVVPHESSNAGSLHYVALASRRISEVLHSTGKESTPSSITGLAEALRARAATSRNVKADLGGALGRLELLAEHCTKETA